MTYKITLVGGGSSTFTPQLMRLFIRSDVLKGSTISLLDIDEQRLETMATLCRAMVQATGSTLSVERSVDQRESLGGADFVISSISVGGFDAWEVDIEVPASYGIFMRVCDSIGPGGIMRAFRHIPPLMEMCRDLEEVAPEAWVFNYTNPLTANSLAMCRNSTLKVVGLCTCSVAARDPTYLIRRAGVESADIIAPALAGGLNHCSAILELRFKDGRDAFPVIEECVQWPLTKWALQTYGVFPYCDGHWLEFYPAWSKLAGEYRGRLQGLPIRFGAADPEHDKTVHDMDKERARVRKWDEVARRLTLGEEEFSLDVLPRDESVQVVEIIESLIENRNEIHVVNVPNRGSIGNLPHDSIVEVSSLVNGYGIHPVNTSSIPDAWAAVLRQHIVVQELTVVAALTGDRQAALSAFLHDPQIAAVLDAGDTEKLLDEMLDAHAAHLPQFR